jgi:hypothetical protein
MRTHWEQEEKQKIPFRHLPQPSQWTKNWTPHEFMLSLLIGLMKLFVAIYGMG